MRSTITVTDFIILLEMTIPFRGFTIAHPSRVAFVRTRRTLWHGRALGRGSHHPTERVKLRARRDAVRFYSLSHLW